MNAAGIKIVCQTKCAVDDQAIVMDVGGGKNRMNAVCVDNGDVSGRCQDALTVRYDHSVSFGDTEQFDVLMPVVSGRSSFGKCVIMENKGKAWVSHFVLFKAAHERNSFQNDKIML